MESFERIILVGSTRFIYLCADIVSKKYHSIMPEVMDLKGGGRALQAELQPLPYGKESPDGFPSQRERRYIDCFCHELLFVSQGCG